MGTERWIAFHSVQRGREVARPLPVENGAADAHRVAPIVAWMVDGDHDIAMSRQSRSKPRHDPRRSAKSVRQQDDRARESVLESAVRSSRAWRESWRPGGPMSSGASTAPGAAGYHTVIRSTSLCDALRSAADAS